MSTARARAWIAHTAMLQAIATARVTQWGHNHRGGAASCSICSNPYDWSNCGQPDCQICGHEARRHP